MADLSKIKVMIALPATSACHTNYTASLALMTRSSQVDLMLAPSQGANICRNRNHLVYIAQQASAEFMLFTDNDLSFPPWALDTLALAALDMKLDIIGCTYCLKTPPYVVACRPKDNAAQFDVDSISEVDRIPTGFMLIRLAALERLEQPYFTYEPLQETGYTTVGTEDYPFCDKFRAAGGSIWLHAPLSFYLTHWDGGRGIQLTREPPYHREVFGIPVYRDV